MALYFSDFLAVASRGLKAPMDRAGVNAKEGEALSDGPLAGSTFCVVTCRPWQGASSVCLQKTKSRRVTGPQSLTGPCTAAGVNAKTGVPRS